MASLPDTVRRKALKLFEKSGMTLEELGLKMGFPKGTARRAVWQLFNKVDDPRLSTVEKLAEALGCQPKDLL
jgi:transcriptional regulator with XRE-family HTH domain